MRTDEQVSPAKYKILFPLLIVFILIFNGQISWLSSQFSTGKLFCQRDEITYIAESDIPKTYNTFDMPKGEGWNCRITSFRNNEIVSSSFQTK